MTRSLWLAILLLLHNNFFQHAVAQPTSTSSPSLKERLAAKCSEHQLPALWAGRFATDGTTQIEVSGVRKWQEPALAETDDPVHLGSCTKAMTAVVIAQLCTEGKLTLDTPLKQIFTDTPQLADSAWGEVKIIDLMQHRSGAIANLDWHQFDRKHPGDVVAARELMLETLLKSRRPKTIKFVYSNVGFALLGHIAEKIESKPWEAIIAERLFARLEIRSAGFGPVGQPDGNSDKAQVIADRPWGHVQSVSLSGLAKSLLGSKDSVAHYEATHIDNSPSLGPAGRVHMNLRDWSKFVLCFVRPDGAQTLGISPEIFQRMLTPPDGVDPNERYAAGWIVFDKPEFDGTCYFHNGSNTTWYAYALAAPNKQCCTLVVSNSFTDGARQSCDEIARLLIKQTDK